MKTNVGKTDAAFRLIAAVVITGLYFFNVISGTMATILLVVAVIFAATAFIRTCPIYSLFGINTCPYEPKKN